MNDKLRAAFVMWVKSLPYELTPEQRCDSWWGYQAHAAAVEPVLREVREALKSCQCEQCYGKQSYDWEKVSHALAKLNAVIGDE